MQLDNASDPSKAWAAQLISDEQLVDTDFPLPLALGEGSESAPAAAYSGSASDLVLRGGLARSLRAYQLDADGELDRPRRLRVAAREEDHMFPAAGNVVLTRGSDDLIVDPRPVRHAVDS